MRTFSVAAAALLLLVAAHAQSPQDEPPIRPTFRASVEYVEVDAHVVDNKGNPVRGLTRDDFQLFEDGKEQAIESFLAFDEPAVVRLEAPVVVAPPDVGSNASERAMQGQVYVILLDDRQIDFQRSPRTIRIAKEFIEKNVRDTDLVAVVSSSGRTDVSQTFTNNKVLLLRSVEGFMGRKYEPIGLNSDAERFFEARAALQAIHSVVDWMAGIRQRSKALVLISEGLNFNYEAFGQNDGGRPQMILEEERETVAAATRANVTIYPIDPRGLADDFVGSVSETRADRERAQMSLRVIAADTGGIAAINTNDFSKASARIATRNSSYYLLGFHSTNPRRDGKFRQIRVRVKKSGMNVTTRRGYEEVKGNAVAVPAAPGPTTASLDVREALNSPLPVGDLPLRVTAAAFRGGGSLASVVVGIESTDMSLAARGRDSGVLEVVTAVIDRRNVIAAAETRRFDLGIPIAGTPAGVGFRLGATLNDIKPGRYQVRVAASVSRSLQRGSVWYDLEVPDFSKGDLAMSGLTFSVAAEGASIGDTNPLNDRIVMPTVSRQFVARDVVSVSGDVYDNALTPWHLVTTVVSVTDTAGNELLRRERSMPSESLQATDGVLQVTTELPLSTLAAGAYLVKVEALRQVNGDNPKRVERIVPIQVVP